MIETFLPEKLKLILAEIRTFFDKMGLKFYKIEQENIGEQSYLRITVSLKIS